MKLAAALCALFMTLGAYSSQSTYSTVSYNQTQLTAFSGQNALDVLSQIPGFKLIENNGKRGLNASGGNVLVDGMTSVSKSTRLSQVLSQLSRTHIQRIEFYTAGHPFSSASQFNQVINIITDKSSTHYQWQLASRLSSAYQSWRPSTASIQLSQPLGSWQNQLYIEYLDHRLESTSNIGKTNADNAVIETGDEHFFDTLNGRQIALLSDRAIAQGHLQITAKRLHDDFGARYHRRFNQVGSNRLTHTHLLEETTKKRYEIGLDWQFPLSHLWESQWTLLNSRRAQYDFESSYSDSPSDRDVFLQDKVLNEVVFQARGKRIGQSWSPELGVEISQNKLTARTQKVGEVQFDTVKETRFEPFVSLAYPLTAQWQMFARLNTELTSLESAQYQSDHTYIKPLLRLTYQHNEIWQLIFEGHRQVDQLDFNQFIDSQQVNVDREQSGNAALQPSKKNTVSAQFNYDVSDHFYLSSTLKYQRALAIHEHIKLSPSEFGIGNAGSADLYSLDFDFTLFTAWILPNSQFRVTYEYRDARYHDPLTGYRVTTDLTPHDWELSFRQDNQQFAWGVTIDLPQSNREFFVDEIYEERDQAEVEAFLEYTISKDVKFKIDLQNATTARYKYAQYFYEGDRAGPFSGLTRFDERVKPYLELSVKGSF